MKVQDIREIIGKNLRRLRLMEPTKEQGPLARKIGLKKPDYISQMETGKRGMGILVLAKLCDALNVHPVEFYRPIEGDESLWRRQLRVELPHPEKQKILSLLNDCHEGDLDKIASTIEVLIRNGMIRTKKKSGPGPDLGLDRKAKEEA